MTTLDKLQGYPWMTDEERNGYKEFMRVMKQQIQERGVPEAPVLVLRVAMLADECVALRRLQTRLHTAKKEKPDQAKTQDKKKTDEEPVVRQEEMPLDDRMLVSLTESVGKGWERIRKGLNELDAYCARVGTPAKRGLAAELEPIMLAARELEPMLAEAVKGDLLDWDGE